MDFHFQETEYSEIKGKIFQVLYIEYARKNIPLLALRESTGLKNNVAYIRDGASSEPADHQQLQRLIGERIELLSASPRKEALSVHLDQLKSLYAELPSSSLRFTALDAFEKLTPKGQYREYVEASIKLKKSVIDKLLSK